MIINRTKYIIPSSITNNVIIALISDFHNSDCVDKIVSIIEKNNIDYIALNGDILYAASGGNSIYHYTACSPQNLRYSQNALRLLTSLTTIAPVLFSTGNHELYLDDEDKDLLRELGVILLDDSFVQIKDLCFGGLSSPYWCLAGTGVAKSKEEHKQRWKMVLDNVHTDWLDEYERQKGLKILLCHHPEFYELYLKERKGIDLILAGHAHGGQVRLFGRGLYAYGQGWFPKYTKGIFDEKMIVSAGVSNTSRFPRFNNPTELVFIELKTKE